MSKPGDFFVGIIDLFAVLLPGGLLAFVLFQQYADFFLKVFPISGNQLWVAYIFASYLLGHLIFMLGARLDGIYNYHREKVNSYTNDSAFACVSEIKRKFLSENECGAINNYQWATAILTTHYPDAVQDINRLVAHSKFFRSLVVIIPIVALLLFSGGEYLFAILVMLLVVPCYLRYYDQRLKSTTRAYQYIVMLNGLGKLS